MIDLALWFFLYCGLFCIGSALALHFQVRVPAFMQHRSAFGQLCQGAGCMFLAQLCAAREANVVTWVMVGLAPILIFVGLRLDQASKREARARARTRTDPHY